MAKTDQAGLGLSSVNMFCLVCRDVFFYHHYRLQPIQTLGIDNATACQMYWVGLQMLINQSNQLLQYYQHSPIRLLSLPAEQNDMIQRLKSFKQRRRKNSSQMSQQHSTPVPQQHSPYLSSFRLEQPQEEQSIDRQSKPSSKSVELSSAIHSKNTQAKLLTIVKEGNGKRKSSVLKHLLQPNTPSNRSNNNQSTRRLAVTRLQKIEKKGEAANDAISKIYRNQLQRRRKEKQLRNVLIISRVRESKQLNLVVRRLSAIKTVPI